MDQQVDQTTPYQYSASQYVHFLLSAGVPAHKGLGMGILHSMWEELNENGFVELEEVHHNPVDVLRDENMEFIELHREIVIPQLGCDGDCYKHPDGMVVYCNKNIKGDLK